VTELAIAEQALEMARAADPSAEVEVMVDRDRAALTRFANSVIHQNVAEDVTSVRVRVHRDGRTVAGSSTLVDEDGLRGLVERTLAAVRVAPLDPHWPGLTSPAAPPELPPVDEATAKATPDDRAAMVQAFVDAAGGLEAAGYCRTNHWSGAFVNSAGQSLGAGRADVAMDGIARNDGADGVARAASSRIADIDGALLGARAAAKATASSDPVELPPGRYEVILEPAAVSDLLENLSVFGFNAKAVAERRSFVRLGDEQFDTSITLLDDAPAAGSAYDAEGTPRRRLVLVDGGTTVGLTHDRRTAAEAGKESSGHGLGLASWGPIGRHFTLAPAASGAVASEVDGPAADSTVAELVAGVQRGVLVSDFWYTRVLEPRTLAITGLTRNGVWLIEDGEITQPLRNFRFTQAYAQALMPGAVLGVGRAATALPGETYSAMSSRWTAPALYLASWNFTGGASG
jgi:predicted Zn-dependent protease